MKGFIEVTLFGYGKALYPVWLITAVLQDDDGTFIEMGKDGKDKHVGVFVAESYDEVKQKIINCEV